MLYNTVMSKKSTTYSVLILCLFIGGAFFYSQKNKQIKPLESIKTNTKPKTKPLEEKPEVVTPKSTGYHSITLGTSKHGAQIIEAVGQDNLASVLSLNRIDIRHLQNNQVIIIPDSFEDPFETTSFPKNIPEISTVPKVMFIAQKEQEFGAYEYGVLIKFGGISTGKKSTPTASRLYYTNWKGKEVTSTSNDEWILKWNFNIANLGGIGIHEYELPGYPASHSCIRLSATDAQWFYDWADQWILSEDEKLLASGTPTLVFGTYGYGKTAPWKNLVQDPNATKVDMESLKETLLPYLSDIQKKQEERNLIKTN
jgi:lipoprotein-anchoring transpeptidase ErfK/SrfK